LSTLLDQELNCYFFKSNYAKTKEWCRIDDEKNNKIGFLWSPPNPSFLSGEIGLFDSEKFLLKVKKKESTFKKTRYEIIDSAGKLLGISTEKSDKNTPFRLEANGVSVLEYGKNSAFEFTEPSGKKVAEFKDLTIYPDSWWKHQEVTVYLLKIDQPSLERITILGFFLTCQFDVFNGFFPVLLPPPI